MKTITLLLISLLTLGCAMGKSSNRQSPDTAGPALESPSDQTSRKLIGVEAVLKIAGQVEPNASWQVRYEPSFEYIFNNEHRTRQAWTVHSLAPYPNTTVTIDAETGEILQLIQSEAPNPTIAMDVAISREAALEIAQKVASDAHWQAAFVSGIDLEEVGQRPVWILATSNMVLYIDAESGEIPVLRQFEPR